MKNDNYIWQFTADDPDHIDYLVQQCKHDPHKPNANGVTALMFMAGQGHKKCIQHLLQKYRVDPEVKNKHNHTALMLAIKSKQLQSVRALVQYGGVDINMADHNGVTPLMMAAKHGSLPPMFYLIEAGAYLNTTCHKGKTALDWAKEHQQEYCCIALENAIKAKENATARLPWGKTKPRRTEDKRSILKRKHQALRNYVKRR